ncbi:hypothetical protein [Rhodovulum sp. YEN HP10]|uniref:hypothetical protein n=1 Tax=Rhodovulum sp. HP10 TaxID=3387397 RepID=UPI0039DFFF09
MIERTRRGAQAPQSVAPAAPYTRAAFGSGWTDPDGDCLDTRAELLAALSTVPVTLAPSGCAVRHGRWFAPYTAATRPKARAIRTIGVRSKAITGARCA